MKYTDHFADKPANYYKFRPTYPETLFNYLASLATQHDSAWDCGTGSGQAAIALAHYFNHVIATDISQEQLDTAPQKSNVHYQQCSAEATPIASASIDLITVAQALHWFDLPRFYEEVSRVLKPTGIIAAWCYSLGTITPELNTVMKKLYDDILGDVYWPKERRYIDEEYKTISFPFQKITPPTFTIEKKMNFADLLGYLQTWSAVKEYQQRNHTNPLHLIRHELKMAWGDPEEEHTMIWPIHLLIGKK